MHCLSTPHLFDDPARGNAAEFLDETYPAKTRWIGWDYLMVKVAQ